MGLLGLLARHRPRAAPPPATGPLAQDALLTPLAWRDLMAALYQHQWVVYAKAPMGGPAQVLDYLARYTHRVAISNDRIVGLNHGTVAFRVRDAAAHHRRVMTLPAVEFIGRFLSHVLPAGVKRIRHCGLLANRHKSVKLAACRNLFDLPPPAPLVIESVEAFMARVAHFDVKRCSCCGSGCLVPCGPLAPLRRPFTPRSSTGPPLP